MRALPPLLVVFALVELVIGVMLWTAPGTFHSEVGPYGPRNDHYMGDLATFYLALAAATFIAARRPAWRVPVLSVSVAEAALHSVNHLIDIGEADPSWLGPFNFASVLAGTVLLAWMLLATRREAPR